MKNSIFTLFILLLVLPGFSQKMTYDVRGIYQHPIIKETLNDAKTISDINPGYPASWIASYSSVEILATCNGIVKKAFSSNDTLNNEQRSILEMADIGTEIVVDVKYSPSNSLIDLFEVKKIHFSFTIIPNIEAEYEGGYDQLKAYLKKTTLDKIPEIDQQQLQLAIVKFTINEEGKATNAHISTASKNEEIDKLLLDAINNMPKWKPAEDSNGLKVKQDFEFSIGNFDGC